MSRVLPAVPRLRERRRVERRSRQVTALRRGAWVLAGLAPFALAAWVLLGSSWLTVTKVAVSGESRLTAAQVLSAADVRLGTPLARLDTGAIAARVRALGPVASVSVTRSWPHTLQVEVVERRPVAAVGSGRSWVLYDGGGAPLGTAAAVPAGLVRLEVAHAGPHDPATEAALQVLRDLPAPLRRLVVAVSASTEEQVGLQLVDGRSVVWGGTADGPAKAAALTALLRMPGHVYDVSSPAVVTRR